MRTDNSSLEYTSVFFLFIFGGLTVAAGFSFINFQSAAQAKILLNKYKVTKATNSYITAADAEAKNKKITVIPDTYYVYNRSNRMINMTKKRGVPGSWINPNETVKVNSKPTYHIVKKGEVLSKIAKQYKTSLRSIMH